MKVRIIAVLTVLSNFLFAQEKKQEFELVKLDRKVNSRYHDTAPVISPDGQTLYFFIANHPENTYGTENSQDIWYCEKGADGFWQKAVHMPAPFNRNRFNQVMSVSTDGNTLLIRGGNGKNQKGFSIVRRVNGKWATPRMLDVKDYAKMANGRFSGGVLSHDGKALVMYFNEEKGAKYSDLYVSFLTENGSYSKPKPLPANINTKRDEFGPFLTADDKVMYFASNRPGGLGSMDVYKTERLDNTWLKWSDPVNIGGPVNTGGFDAYYSVDASGNHGFTTRTFMTLDGGSLDIYGVVPKKKEVIKMMLSGFVFDAKTNESVAANIEYTTKDQTGSVVESDGDDGLYEIDGIKADYYAIEVSAPGYMHLADSIEILQAEKDTVIEKNFYLQPIEVGLTVRLEKIYFDFNKSTLRPESFPELNKVAKLMDENPGLKIEIAGHTDSKGSDDYNLKLSQGRAQAVKDYLVTQWVSEQRIIAKGYGESKPETTNDTDEGRQINRRVEFTVLDN
ncbi:OmpA family protein [Fulvivirgaceae bacterium BMA10]|uniref:OmpA family protein n=1 Tax=Splendidivirga corallicola TaxID=3051826 RepID=A0ABT8KSM3_9BACT|nr:OmpA family protein [Fulvivirgaceae bacterium BMA10]